MRFIVSCSSCVGRIAEFPDRGGAEQLVRRHHGLQGHTAQVDAVLDIPLEGLLQ